MEKIVLIGIGGHAKGIVDTIERQNRFNIVGFVDSHSKKNNMYKNYKVIGCDDDLSSIFIRGGVDNAFVTIGHLGNSDARIRLYNRIKEIGYHIPVIIDDTASVARNVIIDEGTYVGKNAVLNANSRVGRMCIINSGAIVEHDCMIEDFSHIAVGAVVCGESQIGKNSFIGANATVIQCVNISDNVIIGAGTVVLCDVDSNITAHGIWKGKG